jgi:hypothetical protein
VRLGYGFFCVGERGTSHCTEEDDKKRIHVLSLLRKEGSFYVCCLEIYGCSCDEYLPTFLLASLFTVDKQIRYLHTESLVA